MQIDKILLSIFQSSFKAITDEMSISLTKTTRSPILCEAKDFVTVINSLREGMDPKLLENPVCFECQMNGNECVLQKGEPCLGPVIQGGCNAVCLNSKFACKGCRGIIPGYDTKSLEKELLKKHSKKEIESILQIFGIQEDWYKAQK